jgi:surface-anchored protein
MKIATKNLKKPVVIGQFGLTVLLATGLNLAAQPVLMTGHTDVGIAYLDGAWDLHIGQHEADPPAEYAPDEAILGVGPAAQTTVPSNPAFGFLGSPGSMVYILPQAENPSLLFLGFGAEELDPGLFVNNQVTLSLTSAHGPGQFSVYDVDAFGTPNVLMNSGNGITPGDSVVLAAGGHRHVNWGFTEPGTYEVNFEATGLLVAGNQFASSGPVTYTFAVVPEPGAVSLLAVGGVGWLAVTLRRKSRQ